MNKALKDSEFEPDFALKKSRENLLRNMIETALKKTRSIGGLFLLSVVTPTVFSLIYFGFLASDVYVSESRFVVRSPDKQSATGLGALLKTAGFSSTGDEIYAAQSYVLSRDALRAVNKDGAFLKAFAPSSIFYLDRFGTMLTGTTFEDLFKYYETKVKIEHDNTSSITTLTVRAYNGQDAKRFNEQLLEMAEATVNRLNQRGRADLVRFAQAEVDESKQKATAAALALSAFRNQAGVVDPERQATVQIQMISKLQDELIATRNQLLQLRAIAPANPQIEVLQAKASGLSSAIDEQLGKIAGGNRSLSSTAARYQRLMLESQFSDKQLASAMASLEDARNEARRKQAYVERIVQPDAPDDAIEPRRFRAIAATIAFSVIAWGILTMLLAGIREHQQ